MDSNSTPAIDPALDPAFSGMSFAEVCALALQQQAHIKHINAVNAKMAHEMAVLKRLKFAATLRALQPRAEEPARRGHRRRPGSPGARGGQAPATHQASG